MAEKTISFNDLQDISIPNKNEKEIENEEDESFNSNPKKININTALDVLLKDIYGCEATISEAKIKLKEIELKNNERLTKCSDSLCKGFEEIFNNCEKYSGIVNDNIIFNEKENYFINNKAKEFQLSLQKLKEILYVLGDENNEQKVDAVLDAFFREFNKIIEKELRFDNEKYLKICETPGLENGKAVLVHFQVKLMKYELANIFLKEIYEMCKKYYKREKESIFQQLNEIKKQTNDLIIIVSKLTKMKSAYVLYRRWKFGRFKCDTLDFASFINEIKKYVTTVDIIFNDDIISDQVTSLWIIKNNLEEVINC